MNDKNLLPYSTKFLEDNGVVVRSIYETPEPLRSISLISKLVDNSLWGQASDFARYSIVQAFGGVYADLNYIFNRHVTNETHQYNFFSQTFSGYYIDNFIFGASPAHPVINKTLDLVERNLLTPPYYISSILNQHSSIITDLSTANPTYIAYYLTANQEGNIDVVFPYTENENNDMDPADDDMDPADDDMDVVCPKDGEEQCYDNEILAIWAMEREQCMYKLCPQYIEILTDEEILESREICGDELYNIGTDGINGLTWLNN